MKKVVVIFILSLVITEISRFEVYEIYDSDNKV